MTNIEDREFDISTISGNASPHVKRTLGDTSRFLGRHKAKYTTLFGLSIQNRIKITEISVLPKHDEPTKQEGRVVVEMVVEEDMINGGGNIHGGCSAYLIDMCSSLALTAISLTTAGVSDVSVSQAINVIYHSPAGLGDQLRLINTSMSLGNRTNVLKTEIWNATHHRLVASGTHVKMRPSPTPSPKL